MIAALSKWNIWTAATVPHFYLSPSCWRLCFRVPQVVWLLRLGVGAPQDTTHHLHSTERKVLPTLSRPHEKICNFVPHVFRNRLSGYYCSAIGIFGGSKNGNSVNSEKNYSVGHSIGDYKNAKTHPQCNVFDGISIFANPYISQLPNCCRLMLSGGWQTTGKRLWDWYLFSADKKQNYLLLLLSPPTAETSETWISLIKAPWMCLNKVWSPT